MQSPTETFHSHRVHRGPRMSDPRGDHRLHSVGPKQTGRHSTGAVQRVMPSEGAGAAERARLPQDEQLWIYSNLRLYMKIKKQEEEQYSGTEVLQVLNEQGRIDQESEAVILAFFKNGFITNLC